MTRPAAVALNNVVVRFGAKVVLDDVSFAISAGDLIGIRGSNGAGKTTTLRLLVNAYRPNAGERRGPKCSAYVPAAVEPPPMSAKKWLTGVPRPRRTDPASALELLGFDGDLNGACRALSFGNFRKLMLAEAFASGEPLVVVDEASGGLDDVGVAGLGALIALAHASERTIVLADQESRPFPLGTSVFRVAEGGIAAESFDRVERASITLHGPAAATQTLREAARDLGFVEGEGEQ